MSDFMTTGPGSPSFRDLMGNSTKYQVPRFQRDYAWDKEEWEDLWADIEILQEGPHYMGYIVLQRNGKDTYDVIDGQQRLVTLSLVVLVAMKKINNLIDNGDGIEDNGDRLSRMTEQYIGFKDLVSLRVQTKLTLNRNNRSFYKSICDNLNPPDLVATKKTNNLLKEAFSFFDKKYMGSTGSEIAQFVETVSTKFIFTSIIVQDSFNAYKVFETLNARGVQLSTPDLLKNHIFSVISENGDVPDETLDDLDLDWSDMTTQLGSANITDFIRYHHNFQKKYVTKRELYRSARELCDVPGNAYGYLRSLKIYAPVYAALSDPYSEWWKRYDGAYADARKYLQALKLYSIKQPFAVLMIAFTEFSSKEFIALLKCLYIISIRYNVVCSLSPNKQERLYNEMALKIFCKKYKRSSHIKNGEEFKNMYPEDEHFRNSFEILKIPSKSKPKKIRFILAEIENVTYSGSMDYENVSLEHICPYNPNQHWHESFGGGVNDILDRLGNMVILKKDDLGRVSFDEKKQTYKDPDCSYQLAQKVAEYENWDIGTLNSHQSWMAEQAVAIWRVD